MKTKHYLSPILLSLLLVVIFVLATVPAPLGAEGVSQEEDFQPVPKLPAAFAPSYRGTESIHNAASSLDNLNVSLLDEIGGVSYAIDVQESYAYYSEGCELVIFDVSDISNPEIVSKTEPMAGLVRDVQVVDGYLYVAAGNLYVYDVTNPVSPTLVGLFEPFSSVTAFDISGDYAYINDGGYGLRILDISNPKSPYAVGITQTAVWIYDIVVQGDIVYTANEYGLLIFNSSDPYAPFWVGTYRTSESIDLAVEGDYAYLMTWMDYVDIIDVSDPASPTRVSGFGATDAGSALIVNNQKVYFGDAERLRIIDVSDPLSPSELGFAALPGTWINDIALAGNHAFISDYHGALQIVDIADSSVPTLAATYDRPAFANGIVVRDNYAYITSLYDGFNIMDISSPASLELVDSWDTEIYARNVDLSGNFAFVAGFPDGLHVVNISDPSMPSTNSILEFSSSVQDVAIDGSYAFVTTDSGLHAVDISNPSLLQKVGFLDISGEAKGIATVGSYAYVAADDSGLHIIDINNPEKPIARGLLDTPGSAQDVAVSEGYAYVADKDGGVRIIDVSNPDEPVERSSFKQSGTFSAIYDVAVAGKHLYVAGMAGLSVLDVVDPSTPLEVGSYDIPYRAESVAVANGIAYVGASFDGIYALRYTGPGSITIKKQADVADGTSFSFSGDLGSFALKSGASAAFPAIEASEYKVHEDLPLGWYLHEFSCDSEEVSQIENGLTINLSSAADITCTFDNRRLSVMADAGGPYVVTKGSPVLLDASGSSPIEMIKTYEWDCTNDGTWDVIAQNPQGSTCTYDDYGAYTLRLRTWDNFGRPSTDDTSVAVVEMYTIYLPLVLAP